MCITLIFLVLTFTFAAIMVTPDVIWSSYKSSFSLIPLVYHSPQLGKIKKKTLFPLLSNNLCPNIHPN
jgi:hypothetical protein